MFNVSSSTYPTQSVSRALRSRLGLLIFVVLWTQSAGAQLGGGGLPIPLPIDVESVEVDGDFLRNGILFGSDFFDGGEIALRSSSLDETVLGQSWSGPYGPSRLIAGSYQPLFSSFFEPATAPRANGKPFGNSVELDADQTLDFDVPAVQVQISFTLNGFSFPGAASELAEFYMRNVETGREFYIGTSLELSHQFFIVPGNYDVIYVYRSGGSIPANTHARVMENVSIMSDVVLAVDVPSVGRVFTYTLNGVPFPASGLDYGRITLEVPDSGDSIETGRTDGPDFVRLIPGTYRAIYCNRQSNQFTPKNPWAIVDEALTIFPTGSSGVEISVTAHTVQPMFLIDGVSFPVSGLAYGRILLDMGDGDRLDLGNTHQVPDSVVLVEGSYDAYYEVRQPNVGIPFNQVTRFETGIVVDASAPMTFDVPTTTLDLSVLLDGDPFPFSGLDNGSILLLDRETDSETELGLSYEGPFVVRVVQGEYDVVYSRRQTQGGMTPVNPHRVVEKGLSVVAATTETVNIQTSLIAPTVTLDGSAFPVDAMNSGAFYLRDLDGDEVLLGASNVPMPEQRVIQGAYAAEYEWREGDAVPLNRSEIIEIVSVPEPMLNVGLFVGLAVLVFAGNLLPARRDRDRCSSRGSSVSG